MGPNMSVSVDVLLESNHLELMLAGHLMLFILSVLARNHSASRTDDSIGKTDGFRKYILLSRTSALCLS